MSVHDVIKVSKEGPKESVSKWTTQCSVSRSSVFRILKENGLESNEESHLQLLRYNDPEKSFDFRTIYLNIVNVGDVNFSGIIFILFYLFWMGKCINCVAGIREIEGVVMDIVHNIVRI